jgi:energy-coupling factor transport system ATP-binding protein
VKQPEANQHPYQHHQHLPPIVVHNLRLRYPQSGRVVLRGVNLELKRGEVKLLLGPSGTGKSSLALTLNGLIPHHMEGEIRGEVLVNGRSTASTGVPWLTTQVGMVFQDPDAQIATLNVEDEVAFGMENLCVPPDEMPSRIRGALERVGLSGTEDRNPEALSGGQKQRLVLASVLAMGPAVLVLDEPTANLDPAGTSDFFALLAQLKQEGFSILIIEHKLDELIAHVDTIEVLDWSGRIALSGPTREVLAHHYEEVDRLGVWMPQVTELVARLRQCGVRLDTFPLTVEEAVRSIDEAILRLAPAPAHRHGDGRVRAVPGGSPSAAVSAGDAPAAVQVEHLSYSYPDGTLALDGACMNVRRGDFYALVGPNGSGKTTLARHLIGLARPQQGRVCVLGRDIAHVHPADLSSTIGYVFQNPEHQFVTLSVYDELAFSLRARGLPEHIIRQRVEPLLEEFGLQEHREVNPFTLSQGQKRRLSVATMLALEPQILVLDEPTFGQDRQSTENIMNHLHRLNDGGVTIIIITHDMKLVAEHAITVGVMLAGRLAFEGPVDALFANQHLIRQAHLDVPPVLAVGRALSERYAGLAPAMSADRLCNELCAYLAINPRAASSTA